MHQPCETAQDFEPLIMLNMQYVVGQDNESFWKSFLEEGTCTESETMVEPRTKTETGTINNEQPIKNGIETEILSNGNDASQQNRMELPLKLPTQSHDAQSKISIVCPTFSNLWRRPFFFGRQKIFFWKIREKKSSQMCLNGAVAKVFAWYLVVSPPALGSTLSQGEV